MSRSSRMLSFALALVLLVGGSVTWAAAQEATPTEVRLLTPYPGVAVEPGDTASFTLQVVGPPGEEVSFDVEGVPSGWGARIRGGGFVVDRVMIDPALRLDLKFELDIPRDASAGSYELTVTGTGKDSVDSVELAVMVAESVGGGVSLGAEFPVLSGPADIEFSFTLELSNDTGEEIQFGLQAEGAPGWQVSARPSGQTRATTTAVAPGDSERITVEVDPPDFVEAGTYPVVVQASGGGETATAELAVEITGTFGLALATADQRLNLDVEAGRAEEFSLIVVNDGTAALENVSLSATPPRGWEVTFTPESVALVEAGGFAEVVATITPSSDAITGDYRISMRAAVPEAQDSIELRATVETSGVWGLVGILVILAALGGLAIVFRRFGRR